MVPTVEGVDAAVIVQAHIILKGMMHILAWLRMIRLIKDVCADWLAEVQLSQR